MPIFLLGMFFLSDAPFLAAQSEAGNNAVAESGAYIASISITGLRRTRPSAAERPLRRFIGLPSDQVDTNDVMAAIVATGILQPVSVEIEGDVLVIEVQERWSFFPVPVAAGGTEGMSGGLALFDANAFGLNDQLFLAAFFHADGFITSAGYFRSSRGGRSPGYSGMAAFARRERHDRDQNAEVLRRFDLDTITLNAGVHFPLLEDSDLLSVSALLSFSDRSLRNRSDALYGPQDSLTMFGSGAEFAVRRNSWDGYFLSQEAASVRYFFHTDFGGVSFQAVQLRGIWERSLVPGFRFNMRTGLVFQPQVPVLFESSPGAAQVDILPRDFSARNYAGFSAGLEKRIFATAAGTFSLAGAYQAVYSYGSALGHSADQGYTVTLSFYLNRLAIPALGLGVAHNITRNYVQGFFSIGMSF